MITWPVFCEQVYNEKLVTEILRVGVAVGAEKWVSFVDESVKSEASVNCEEGGHREGCDKNHGG